ncbi:MAG: 50S ribosomal protein L3 [Alphaproteobacteria bacterium GM202ARS2]|nr:50S ribosomal protein L3 [Alphaproteobacteria bacterium GM202ARS2]
MRVGLCVKKLGMSRLFNEEGQHVPVSVLRLESCSVVRRFERDKDGFDALQLGFGDIKEKRLNKPQRGAFAKSKQTPRARLRQFRVSERGLLDVGTAIDVHHFVVGQYVDISGITIGKGFAGAMKRHNFGGGRASHGVSVSHRAHGSTGQCQDPGKVFKGKKMAGHMGASRVTHHNLKVVKVDSANGLIFVHGAVPGPKGSYLDIRDAYKKPLPDDAPWPAGLHGQEQEEEQEQEQEQEQATEQATEQVKDEQATESAPEQEAQGAEERTQEHETTPPAQTGQTEKAEQTGDDVQAESAPEASTDKPQKE